MLIKVATLMHDVFHHRCPPFLRNFVSLLSLTPLGAFSDHSQDEDKAWRTRFFRLWVDRDRVEQSNVWNSIIDCRFTFRRRLKSHLFQIAF